MAENNSGKSTLKFLFDPRGRQLRRQKKLKNNVKSHFAGEGTESESLEVRTSSPRRRSSCFRCILCLLGSMIILVLVFTATVVIVAKTLNAGHGMNYTQRETDEFYETWEAPEEIRTHARAHFRKDKSNLTVWFIDCGHWNWDELLKTNETREAMNTYMDQSYYRIMKEVSQGLRGSNNGSWALVINMDGYTLAQSLDLNVLAYMQELSRRHVTEYEMLDYAIVINMPYWSRFMVEFLRPVLGNAMDRFEFFGHDGWLPTVWDRIEASELPEGYGAYVEVGDDSWF